MPRKARVDERPIDLPLPQAEPRASSWPLWVASILLILCAGGWVGSNWLWAQFVRSPEYLLTADQIVLAPAHPDWLTIDLRRQILGDATISLLDPNVCRQLKEGFEASPWIERVIAVRRGYRRLTIEAIYREPVLFVPWQAQGCYVDRTATVVPAADVKDHRLRSCLYFDGEWTGRSPAVGQTLDDARIRTAATLAAAWWPNAIQLDLRAISCDVSGTDDYQVAFRCRHGCIVRWKSGESDLIAHELLTHQQRMGRLDAPDGPYRYDLVDIKLHRTRL